MAIEVFNRVESKYFLDPDTYKDFKIAIEPYMEYDKYCIDDKHYSINNIYYDTDTNELIRRSIEKPIYKEKLRMRSYGVPELDTKVFLEIKKKYRGVVNKRRTKIKLSQAYDFIDTLNIPTEGDYLNGQVLKELRYFIDFYKPVPKLFLKYDRRALFCKDDPNLRITFDKNITTRRYDLKLEMGDYGEKLLTNDKILMEIKTVDSLPLWLTKILADMEIKKISFSKYGTEYKNFIEANREHFDDEVNETSFKV